MAQVMFGPAESLVFGMVEAIVVATDILCVCGAELALVTKAVHANSGVSFCHNNKIHMSTMKKVSSCTRNGNRSQRNITSN